MFQKNNFHRIEGKKEIEFCLTDIKYVPEDNHQFYFDGRSLNEDIGGITAVTRVDSYEAFFYFQRKIKFRDLPEVKQFLIDIQRLLDNSFSVKMISSIDLIDEGFLNGVKIEKNNPKCKSSNLDPQPRLPGYVPIKEHMRNAFKRFELCEKQHKTAGYYQEEHIQTIKLYVKYPYMTSSIVKFFASLDYLNWITSKNKFPDWIVRCYEGLQKSPELILMNHYGITACGWYRLEKYEYCKEKISYKKTNIVFDPKDLISIADKLDQPPLRILSFDIETCCLPGKDRFPIPLSQNENDEDDCDKVIIICCTLFEDRSEYVIKESKSFYLNYPEDDGKFSPVIDLSVWLNLLKSKYPKNYNNIITAWNYDKLEMKGYDKEYEMIIDFVKYMHSADVDAITGWNIDYFDVPFLSKRIEYYKLKKMVPQTYNLNFGYYIKKKSILSKNSYSSANRKKGVSEKAGKTFDHVTHFGVMDIDGISAKYPKLRSRALESSALQFLTYDKSILNIFSEEMYGTDGVFFASMFFFTIYTYEKKVRVV